MKLTTEKKIWENEWTRSWFFEKNQQNLLLLEKLTNKKREKTPITKIRNETERYHYTPTDIKSIKRILQWIYVNKVDNLDEMDQLLKKYKLPQST